MEDPKRANIQSPVLQSTAQPNIPAELKASVSTFKKRLTEKGNVLSFEKLVYMSGFLGVLRNIAFAPGMVVLKEKIKILSGNLFRNAEMAQAVDSELLESYRQSEIAIDKATTLLMSEKISPYLSDQGESRDISVFVNETVVELGLQLYKRSKAIDLDHPTQIIGELLSDTFKRYFTQAIQHFSFTEGQLENKNRVFTLIADGLDKSTRPNKDEMVGALIDGTFNRHLESIAKLWDWPTNKLHLIDPEWQKDFTKAIPILSFFDLSCALDRALSAKEPLKIEGALQKFTDLSDALYKVQPDFNELNGLFAQLISNGMKKCTVLESFYYKDIIARIRLTNCLFQLIGKKVDLENSLLELAANEPQKIKKRGKKKKTRRVRSKQSGVEYWEKKEPAKQRKEKKPIASVTKACPIAVFSPVARPLTEAEVLEKYRFDPRIFAKKDLYHGHSLIIHPVLKYYGKKRLRVNSTNTSQKDRHYSLPGMIVYRNSKPKYCFFHACEDPKGTCYHRGFDIVTEELFSKEGQDIEYTDQVALSELGESDERNSSNSSIVLDDNVKIVIYDRCYGCLLVVFKHSFS